MHDAEDGEAGVQSDEVGEFQRAHGVVHSEFHGEVYVGDAADIFHAGEECFVKHGHQDAIGDEAGEVGGADGRFAEFAGERFGSGHCDGGGFGAGNNFHQRHDGDGVHEVHADEVFGMGESGGEFGDGDGRGVGGEDGLRTNAGADFAQHGALDGDVFGDGFHGEFGVFQPLPDLGADDDARDGGLGVLGGELSFFGEAVDAAGDGFLGARELVGIFVVQVGAESGNGARLGDAAAHLSGAQNGDALRCHLACGMKVGTSWSRKLESGKQVGN